MIRVVLLLFVINSTSFSVFAENITNNHPSPYVRMHANDAVKWQVWDRTILARAKKENKLIFISSGYYACHWCHVMREESFTDEAVAKLINKYFIPVKIDRELSPVLDAYLMGFINNVLGYAGWPLNVFVTPQGYPLTGLVYLPKDNFLEAIESLNERWVKQNTELKQLALKTFKYTEINNSELIKVSEEDLFAKFIMVVSQKKDDLEGGFGEKSRFPMPHLMNSLLEVYELNKDEELGEFINLSLHQMVDQGLHDAIGGGFFRYTVDQGWQTPHFEKMLYTNAAMIRLYFQAYRLLGNKKWLQVAEETLEFVIRDMKMPEGGYVSSISAQDMSGVEGGNYLWSKETLDRLLSKKQKKWFDRNVKLIDMQNADGVLPAGFMQGDYAQKIKKKLRHEREKKPLVKDKKMVISWNAFLLSSMIDVAEVSENRKFNDEAQQLYIYIKKQIKSGLVRSAESNPQRYFEDYVFVLNAMWEWGETRGSGEDKKDIKKLLDEVHRLFKNSEGWKQTDREILPMPKSIEGYKDGNLPAVNVVMMKLVRVLNTGAVEVDFSSVKSGIPKRIISSPLEYSGFIVTEYHIKKSMKLY